MTHAPPPNPDTVTLRAVTRSNLREVLRLRVRDDQTQFVATNAISIAEAYFASNAWFRAIYAGETPVGFVMLEDDPAERMYYVWRFMIDQNHQGNGYGRRAMELIVEHVRTRPNASRLLLSYRGEEGSPEGFYRKLGFIPTGDVEDGEIYAALAL